MNHAAETWATLVRASVDNKHPWRTPALCTQGLEGPNARHVVLRKAMPDAATLVFYTDRRSQKMRDLEHCNTVSLVFWNPKSNTQLRVWGTARIENDDVQTEQYWARVPDHARRDYATLSAPGSALNASDEQAHDMSLARQCFTVLLVQVDRLDCLQLSRLGHLRWGAQRNSQGEWMLQDLVP
ncbi:pyridoxamine 5'-phosphate oxidase family protein [Limnobacter humi]|uniref:Pyridoxamine 5'-phosphate oxidase family protein n=1 Tax=Limnobacter humi TaxID=1778671 RepID=A0ABT1WK34_9BURK|nr:pyridoxamine 5'-phosphate oxidase family protein [Limnobacter humi]MCQ8897293.1 pyridoxamine 5'-phosphate oxidase family protein [Limnobacter humi]